MSARVYVIPISHPARAGAGMVAHAGIAHRIVTLPPGPHPVLVRMAGFPGWTVPALELPGGRRLQGTLAISRAMDELAPERPLFPRGRVERRAVEDAEAWGHSELQPLPRRIFRWVLLRDPALRRWLTRDVLRWPAPAALAAFAKPMVRALARASGAEDAVVEADLRRLPALLDRVDLLHEAKTIGADEPNAADFQILSSIRVLLEFTDLAALTQGRPCATRARRLFPSWEGPIPSSTALRRQLSDGSAGIVDSSL